MDTCAVVQDACAEIRAPFAESQRAEAKQANRAKHLRENCNVSAQMRKTSFIILSGDN